jgi:hypothetical protein
MKKCPYCTEYIQAEAIVCRHCGRDLIKTVPLHLAVAQYTQAQPNDKSSAILFVIAGLVITFGVVFIIVL